MLDGFLKTAAATPTIRVADPAYNAQEIAGLLKQAAQQGVKFLVFPELCLTGYTCGDLFLQPLLLSGAEQGLAAILEESKSLPLLAAVGLPVAVEGKLYNCAAVFSQGKLLGLVPKLHIPNYSEFYEQRHFTSGAGTAGEVTLCGQTVPFGEKLLFRCEDFPLFTAGFEICEDLWVAQPPSGDLAEAGALVIGNLSASDEMIGKEDYRRQLVSSQSARLVSGYVYADAGYGESSTDLIFAGHNLIGENGSILTESKLFENQLVATELDLFKLAQERRRLTTYRQGREGDFRVVSFSLPVEETTLTRRVDPHPFVPSDETQRTRRCESIFAMQTTGLCKRLEHSHSKTAVVGLSGGLDSTLALLVAARAMKRLGRPASDVVAVTMPCFGTTSRTRSNAETLAQLLGVTFRTVDLKESVLLHFKDIGHDVEDHSVVYENGQARMRTLVLMNIANQTGGLVIGTGDLSELALGWATYNGDHMSMYGVNASIPKTLIRHMVRYVADTGEEPGLRQVLLDILDTPVSPELLPPTGEGTIAQVTEDLVGPYELHDFFLYYGIRWGFEPKKVYRLCRYALGDVYDNATILKWLETFYRRFFAQQFKRSCLPDGPKVGSMTLSPRGDWRMPSDASAALWLEQIGALKP